MGCNQTGEWVSGNVLIRPMYLHKAGDEIQGHSHNFDHTSIVFYGAVRIEAKAPDGREFAREFKSPRPDWGGPSHALIKAEVIHKLIATEDDTIVWCTYAHRNAQGEVVQQYNGWQDAYT